MSLVIMGSLLMALKKAKVNLYGATAPIMKVTLRIITLRDKAFTLGAMEICTTVLG